MKGENDDRSPHHRQGDAGTGPGHDPESQEAVTDAIKAWAETVQSLTPSLPTTSAPYADKLPTPSEVVADAYDFAEHLLAAQRKFAEDVLQATAPVFIPKEGSKTAKSGAAAR